MTSNNIQLPLIPYTDDTTQKDWRGHQIWVFLFYGHSLNMDVTEKGAGAEISQYMLPGIELIQFQ